MKKDVDELLLLKPYLWGKQLSKNDIPSLIIGAGGDGLPIRMAIMESVEARHFVFAADFREQFNHLELAPVNDKSIDLNEILKILDVSRLNVLVILPDQVVKELSILDMPNLLEQELMKMNMFPIRPVVPIDDVPILIKEPKNKPKIWQKPLNNKFNNRAFQTQKHFRRKK
jgi:hypothetical protein